MKTTLLALLAVFALSHNAFADDTASPDMTKDSTTKTENSDGTTTMTKKHVHKRGSKMMKKKKIETTAPSDAAPADTETK